jgi:TonB family protein
LLSQKFIGSIVPFRLRPAKSTATAATVCAMLLMGLASVLAQTASSQDVQQQAVPAAQTNPQLLKWKSRVQAHVASAIRRLADAPDSGGTALVAFTIDRKGKVLSGDIRQSSGNDALDAATIVAVRRASPVPRPPAEISGEQVSLTLPVGFHPKVQKQLASSRQTNSQSLKWQHETIVYISRFIQWPQVWYKPLSGGGIVLVNFDIDRTGKVLSAKIYRSSGDTDLDDEAIWAVRRASPIPPPPAVIPDRQISLILPVNFRRE